jgi:hypothetical protein
MTTVLENFERNIDSVKDLMSFDRYVLESAIQAIDKLHQQLLKLGLENPALNAERTLVLLRGFQTNDSLRFKYQTIFNQGLVLLVSYFASATHDLFRGALQASITDNLESPVLSEELKITVGDLKDAEFDLRDSVAELFIRTRDISFQDMKSIARAFNSHLNIHIQKDEAVHEIILGQACRHVIVHAGGMVNASLLRQISAAKPRTLKVDLTAGQAVEFSPQEVEFIAEKMRTYLKRLSLSVEKTVGVKI